MVRGSKFKTSYDDFIALAKIVNLFIYALLVKLVWLRSVFASLWPWTHKLGRNVL